MRECDLNIFPTNDLDRWICYLDVEGKLGVEKFKVSNIFKMACMNHKMFGTSVSQLVIKCHHCSKQLFMNKITLQILKSRCVLSEDELHLQVESEKLLRSSTMMPLYSGYSRNSALFIE